MTNPTSGDPGQPYGPNYNAGPSDWGSAPVGDSPFAGSWTTAPAGTGEPADRFAASPGGYTPDPNDVPPSRRRGNGVLIGGALVVVAALAIGVGAFVFLGSDDSTDTANGSSAGQSIQDPPDNPVVTIDGAFPTMPIEPVPLEIGATNSAEFTSSADTLLVHDAGLDANNARTFALSDGKLRDEFRIDATGCDRSAFGSQAVCINGDEVKLAQLDGSNVDPVALPGLTDVLVTAEAVYAGGREGNKVWIANVTPGAPVPARYYDSPGPACAAKDKFLDSAATFVSFGGILINRSTRDQIGNSNMKVLGAGSAALLQECGNDQANIQVFNADGGPIRSHPVASASSGWTTQVPTTAARNETAPAPSVDPNDPLNPRTQIPTTELNEQAPASAAPTLGGPVSSSYAATVIDSNWYAIGGDVFDTTNGKKAWSTSGGKAVTQIFGDIAVVNDGTAIHLYIAADGTPVQMLGAAALPAPDKDSPIIYDGQHVLVTHGGELIAIALDDGSMAWKFPLAKGKVTPTAAGLLLTSTDGVQYFAAPPR